MELIDVVNEKNEVVGKATRKEVHEKKLPHRTVMFFVVSNDGRVLITKRSNDKEFFGGHWSVVLGGHVSSGDSYEKTLLKEMEEEIGTVGEHVHIGNFVKELPEEIEHVSLFKTTVPPEEVRLNPNEFQEGEFVPFNEIDEHLKHKKFLPETETVLDKMKDFDKTIDHQ